MKDGKCLKCGSKDIMADINVREMGECVAIFLAGGGAQAAHKSKSPKIPITLHKGIMLV